MTISQTIEAMVHHQNVKNAIVWNNEIREYQSIVTLRDLLECTLYVAEKLQDAINTFENSHLQLGEEPDPQTFTNMVRSNA